MVGHKKKRGRALRAKGFLGEAGQAGLCCTVGISHLVKIAQSLQFP